MLTPDAPRPPSSATPGSAPSRLLTTPAAGELILLVDDQPSIRDLLETILTSHGYRTVTAVDGDDALNVFSAQQNKIAAVITDMHMPGTGGESLADLLRRVRPTVPILFMSGLGGDSRPVRPQNSRDPFLLKPFRPVALLETLHRLLHPGAAPQS